MRKRGPFTRLDITQRFFQHAFLGLFWRPIAADLPHPEGLPTGAYLTHKWRFIARIHHASGWLPTWGRHQPVLLHSAPAIQRFRVWRGWNWTKAADFGVCVGEEEELARLWQTWDAVAYLVNRDYDFEWWFEPRNRFCERVSPTRGRKLMTARFYEAHHFFWILIWMSVF